MLIYDPWRGEILVLDCASCSLPLSEHMFWLNSEITFWVPLIINPIIHPACGFLFPEMCFKMLIIKQSTNCALVGTRDATQANTLRPSRCGSKNSGKHTFRRGSRRHNSRTEWKHSNQQLGRDNRTTPSRPSGAEISNSICIQESTQKSWIHLVS